MSRRWARAAWRAALGARLPVTAGRLEVAGLAAPVTIARDAHAIPTVQAADEAGAWFGLGFCHGQDRAFQLEGILRTARGTLAALVGPRGVPVDRFSRRLGFHRAARAHEPLLPARIRERIAAYAAGINAAHACGRRPHELVLLRTSCTPWTPADVVAYVHLQAFGTGANWLTELARQKLLETDGAEALRALDPLVGTAGRPAGAGVLEALEADLRAFLAVAPGARASNAWALAGARTAGGRPLFANDFHLAPFVPTGVYLAQLRTPDWRAVGASFVGAPGLVAGHNGRVAWGITAGMADLADCFLEELGPGGTVREGDGWAPCERHVEAIAVRRRRTVAEEVLVTPRGPIVGPVLDGVPGALSVRFPWHARPPLELGLDAHRAASAGELLAGLDDWSVLSLNFVAADDGGSVGRRLAGRVPVRRLGNGVLPQPGWEAGPGWEPDPVGAADMPAALDPPGGVVVSTNDRPPDATAFVGVDFDDGFRGERLAAALGARDDWDAAASRRLQGDTLSLPWGQLRDRVLAAAESAPDLRTAAALLRAWDGRLEPTSPAAAVWALGAAELTRRVAERRAPNGWRYMLGAGFDPLAGRTLMCVRRMAHLLAVLREHPEGWCGRPWEEEIVAALRVAVERLGAARGPDPAGWSWGAVRRLTLRHPAGRGVLGPLLGLGPVPLGGDGTTVAVGSVAPDDPLGDPALVPMFRMDVEVGAWDDARFVIAGGQSGNPCSRHYDDLLGPWQAHEGVRVAWSGDGPPGRTLRLDPRR